MVPHPPETMPPQYSQCQTSLGTVRLNPYVAPFFDSHEYTPLAEVFRSSAWPLWWFE